MSQIGASLVVFLRDESGATAIEYGLIGALISIAIVAGATQVGSSVRAFFELANNSFPKG